MDTKSSEILAALIKGTDLGAVISSAIDLQAGERVRRLSYIDLRIRYAEKGSLGGPAEIEITQKGELNQYCGSKEASSPNADRNIFNEGNWELESIGPSNDTSEECSQEVNM